MRLKYPRLESDIQKKECPKCGTLIYLSQDTCSSCNPNLVRCEQCKKFTHKEGQFRIKDGICWACRRKNTKKKRQKEERKQQRALEDKHGFVYLLMDDQNRYKIGLATVLDNRIKQLNVKMPYELQCIHYIPCEDRFFAEKALHKIFAHRHIAGEWFCLSPDEVVLIKRIESM